MTIARFLFNDYFKRANFTTPAIDGVSNGADVLSDGQLHTKISSANLPVDNRLVLTYNRAINGNRLAVINNSLISSVAVGSGSDNATIFPDTNYQINVAEYTPNASSALVLNTSATGEKNLNGSASLVYMGTEISQAVYYDRGWTPPIVQPVERRITTTERGFPIHQFTRQMGLTMEIPFTFISYATPTSNPTVIKNLLQRMQQEPFLFQWADNADWVWCYATENGIGDLSYQFATYLKVYVEVRAWWDFS